MPVQRFARKEIKLVLPIANVNCVREKLAEHMHYDPYSLVNASHAYRYRIVSLYLDSPNLIFFHDHMDGLCYRKKLRLRHYPGSTTNTLGLEIKRKHLKTGLKERLFLHPEHIDLQNPMSMLQHLDRQRDLVSYNVCKKFAENILRYRLAPKLKICYEREAWMKDDLYRSRVTFDFNVRVSPWSGSHGIAGQQREIAICPGEVIMEVKCLRALPNWLRLILREIRFHRQPFSKYCQGILAITGHPESKQPIDAEHHYELFRSIEHCAA